MDCLFLFETNRYTSYCNNSKLHNILLHALLKAEHAAKYLIQ